LRIFALIANAADTENVPLPAKALVAAVSGAASLARVTPATVTEYDCAACDDVTRVTTLPVSDGVPLNVNPGTL